MSQRKILIVDDELSVRQSLQEWFLEDGFEVETAEDGAAALRKMVGERLDPHRWLRRAQERVETGWGACMLYRVLRPPRPLAGHPHHFELIADPEPRSRTAIISSAPSAAPRTATALPKATERSPFPPMHPSPSYGPCRKNSWSPGSMASTPG